MKHNKPQQQQQQSQLKDTILNLPWFNIIWALSMVLAIGAIVIGFYTRNQYGTEYLKDLGSLDVDDIVERPHHHHHHHHHDSDHADLHDGHHRGESTKKDDEHPKFKDSGNDRVEVLNATVLASANEVVERLVMVNVPCEAGVNKVPDCSPLKCGRAVVDNFATEEEIDTLRRLVDSGLKHGGGNGPPSILDLSSGAMSFGDKFVNIFAVLGEEKAKQVFLEEDLAVYKKVMARIKDFVMTTFGGTVLHHVGPNFFSRINGSIDAVTEHDEYWHYHVDRLQYANFEYTTLLYLSDFGKDFQGGEFAFLVNPSEENENLNQVQIVEPKRGRLLFFTSGKENVHRVLPVKSGVRWALTVAFTCDEKKALTSVVALN